MRLSPNPKVSKAKSVRKAAVNRLLNELTASGVFLDAVHGVGSVDSRNEGDTNALAETTSDRALHLETVSNVSHLLYRLMSGMGVFPEIERVNNEEENKVSSSRGANPGTRRCLTQF
jgi:hypothetical protein